MVNWTPTLSQVSQSQCDGVLIWNGNDGWCQRHVIVESNGARREHAIEVVPYWTSKPGLRVPAKHVSTLGW